MTLEKLEEFLDLLIRISTVFSLAGSHGSVLISQQFILTSFNEQGKNHGFILVNSASYSHADIRKQSF